MEMVILWDRIYLHLDVGLPEILSPGGIKPEENEEQYRKCPKGRSPITKEGERDSYYRGKPNGHRNIYGDMKKQDTGNSIAVDSAKLRSLSLGKSNKPD